MYGRLGANVVVNDVNEKGANAVVDEVIKGTESVFYSIFKTWLLTPIKPEAKQ